MRCSENKFSGRIDLWVVAGHQYMNRIYIPHSVLCFVVEQIENKLKTMTCWFWHTFNNILARPHCFKTL